MKPRRITAAAALVAAGLALGAAPAGAHGGPVAVTDRGVVRGFTAEGVDQFLGIPYAAPPVGPLRWRPPQPAARWHGVRAATTLPSRCPQLANSNGPRSETEDCLYLSVFGRRPVGPPRRGCRCCSGSTAADSSTAPAPSTTAR